MAGQRVEMAGGAVAIRQRGFELRQLLAHPITITGRLGVTTGQAPLVQQHMVRRPVALLGQHPGTSVDLHFGQVDERLQPSHRPPRVAQLTMVGHGQVDPDERLDRLSNSDRFHAHILRTGVSHSSSQLRSRLLPSHDGVS